MMSADLPAPRLSAPSLSRPRPARDRLVIGAILGLFALGLYGVGRATDWSAIIGRFTSLGVWQALTLLALSLANYLLRARRWHLFARSLGLRVTGRTSLIQYFGGFAMSVTPGKIGELVRVRWLARAAGVPLERAAPVALGDRAADLAALAILLAAAIPLAARITGAGAVAALALVAAFVATQPGLLAAAIGVAHRLTGRRLPRPMARLRHAARALGAFAQSHVLVPALALGLAGWLAEAYAFHLLLGWFGADIRLPRAIAIFVFSTLAGGLTGAPGGLGGAEAAMVALLSLDGVPVDVAVAATLLIRATTLWFAVLIGMISFPFAERGSHGELT